VQEHRRRRRRGLAAHFARRARTARDSASPVRAGKIRHARPSFDAGARGVGLTLGALSHIGGWPVPRGGAQRITDALVAHLRSLGGDVVTNTRIANVDELPPAAI